MTSIPIREAITSSPLIKQKEEIRVNSSVFILSRRGRTRPVSMKVKNEIVKTFSNNIRIFSLFMVLL